MNGSLWGISVLLLVLAAAAMIGILILNDRIRKDEFRQGRTEGKVVAISPVRSALVDPLSEFHDLYYAEIEYYADGKLIRVHSREQEFPSSYYVGQRLKILYDRESPEQFLIRRYGPKDIAAIGLRILAAVLLLSGVIVFLVSARA